MPTFETTPLFDREFHALQENQRRLFREAVKKMIEDFDKPAFRKSLRVKRFHALRSGVYEISWAANGRALFEYGKQVHSGQPHIVWKSIGTHSVFKHQF